MITLVDSQRTELLQSQAALEAVALRIGISARDLTPGSMHKCPKCAHGAFGPIKDNPAVYKCLHFSCGFAGNAAQVIELCDCSSLVAAFKVLEAEAGSTPAQVNEPSPPERFDCTVERHVAPYESALAESPETQAWLRKRGITEEVWKELHYGYKQRQYFGCGKRCSNCGEREALVLPRFWKGELVGVKYRALDPLEKHKWFQEKGSASDFLYAADIEGPDIFGPAVLGEGELEAALLRSQGFNGIAALGARGIPESGKQWERFEESVREMKDKWEYVLAVGDQDPDGEGAVLRLVKIVGADYAVCESLPEDKSEHRRYKDFGELFAKHGADVFSDELAGMIDFANSRRQADPDPEFEGHIDRLQTWDGQGTTPELRQAPEGYPKDLDDSVIFGPTKEFVDLCLPCVEMDRNGLVAFFLCAVGSILGRRIYKEAGSVRHFPATYHGVIAGTSEGKGPAQAAALSLGGWVDDDWKSQAVFSGAAASGQGLVRVLAEAHAKSEGRVYKELGELAALLAVAKRETDPMSANLRDAWDFKRLNKPASKVEDSIVADNYALSCSAGITVRELRERVGTADWANGLAGRFIWTAAQARVWHKRPKPMASLRELGLRLKQRLPDRNSNVCIDYTDNGARVWDNWVEELEAWVKGPNVRHTLLADACGKLRANALRVAMIFAALEGPTWNKTYAMDEQHVKAATAFINRSRDSLVWVFNHGQTKAESSENKQKFNELINKWTNQLPDEEFRKAFSHMTPEERNTLASSCYAKCKPAPLTGKPGRPGKIWTR
jgi:Protein of unknown function (DUF3987)